VKCLDGLERFGEEGSEAVELISSMLSTEASDRYVCLSFFFASVCALYDGD